MQIVKAHCKSCGEWFEVEDQDNIVCTCGCKKEGAWVEVKLGLGMIDKLIEVTKNDKVVWEECDPGVMYKCDVGGYTLYLNRISTCFSVEYYLDSLNYLKFTTDGSLYDWVVDNVFRNNKISYDNTERFLLECLKKL